MDQAPVCISEKFPMEIVIEFFKKMGLRYVLVVDGGLVKGLITKKDVIRHISSIRT